MSIEKKNNKKSINKLLVQQANKEQKWRQN